MKTVFLVISPLIGQVVETNESFKQADDFSG